MDSRAINVILGELGYKTESLELLDISGHKPGLPGNWKDLDSLLKLSEVSEVFLKY